MQPAKDNSRPFVLYAPNVHIGGGEVLLRALLEEGNLTRPVRAFLDERFTGVKIPPGFEVRRVRPQIRDRLRAEFELARESRNAELIFSFGNLPPLLKPGARVFVYFQNRNLFASADLSRFSHTLKAKHRVERLWLRARKSAAIAFLVQTPSMRTELMRDLGAEARVEVMPFVPRLEPASPASRLDFDFAYVASSEPHKNHARLLEAWRKLAEGGSEVPKLALTCEPLPGARPEIQFFPNLPRPEIWKLYARSRALIFPSLLESFGLPLIEAARAGLPILASDLEYVREVVRPTAVFDPLSAADIARAARVFSAEKSAKSADALDFPGPRQFLENLWELAARV